MFLLIAPALAQPASLNSLQPEALSEAICAQTNRARVAAGVDPLPIRPALNGAALLHSEQMAIGDFFHHTAPETAPWPTVADRFAAVGILNPYPAENIATWAALDYRPGDAYQTLDPDQLRFAVDGQVLTAHTPKSFASALVAGWMKSPGHRANILSQQAVSLGCAASPYLESGFPMLKAVQVFQWFEPLLAEPEARSAAQILAGLFEADAPRRSQRDAEPVWMLLP